MINKFDVSVIHLENDRIAFTAEFSLCGHTGCSGLHANPLAAMAEAHSNWHNGMAWTATDKVIAKVKG